MASRQRGLLCISLLLLAGASSSYEEAMGSSILLSGGGEREDDEPFEYPRHGLSCPSPDHSLYNLPVIGIVSHPGDGTSGRMSNASRDSNIPASYVKFVESAGARVIPLIYNEPEETLLEKLNLVNGVLFTGGWAKEGLYYETIKKVFKIALERNDSGEHFPLFAICLGFELLSMIISKDLGKKVITFTPSVFQCRLHSSIKGDKSLGQFIADHHVVTQVEGVVPYILLFCITSNAALSSFFRILTTSKDENGKVYVSTVQAYNYPVTGFQWHPEETDRKGVNTTSLSKHLDYCRKNAFEWGLSMIPHSEDAVCVTQHVANYFISDAGKSSNRPHADRVLDNPTYCGRAGRGYDEVYIFNCPRSSM